MKEHDIRPEALLAEFFALLKEDARTLAAESSTFIRVPCPFCGGSEEREAFRKDGFRYCECGSCASLFVSPRPTSSQLLEHILSSRAVEFWSTKFYRQTAASRREHIFRPRARAIADLRKGVLKDARSLADIGSGYGLFLAEMRDTGEFEVLKGVEPDARLAGVCREQGFDVVETWVEDLEDGDLMMDCVTAFEVLEHVFDPLEFVKACARALRPGGVLILTTLTIGGFDLQVLWEHSRSITPPQHLNFPSLAGMQRLVERAGLRTTHITTPGKLDVDIVRNVIADHPEIPVPRFARALADSSAETRAEFQRFLQANLMSSHLNCVITRPE